VRAVTAGLYKRPQNSCHDVGGQLPIWEDHPGEADHVGRQA
jgi:hypothetical protein